MQKSNNNTQKAFISIFAIFFSAILTSVLLSLFILLMKQIQLLSIDSTSFQSYYTADSSFECAVYVEKENNKNSYAQKKYAYNTTFFRPENWGSFNNCNSAGDIVKVSSDIINGKAKSIFKYSIDIDADNRFCGIINIERNITDSPDVNKMSITGRSVECGLTSGKVIERGIDFIY